MSQPTRPLYHRLLRLNHIRLRGTVAFALFEGSIGLAVLLVFADLVSWWGVLAIPGAVALMVKLNDVVAGSARPLAFAHLGTSRLTRATIVGRSAVPRPSRPTVAIDNDDAVADPAAHPDSPPTARGRAASIARGVATVPPDDQGRWRPMPTSRTPEPALPDRATDFPELPIPRGRNTHRRPRSNEGRFTC